MDFFKNIIADAKGDVPDGNFAAMKDAAANVSSGEDGWRYTDFGLPGTDFQRAEPFSGQLMRTEPAGTDGIDTGSDESFVNTVMMPSGTYSDTEQNGVSEHNNRAEESGSALLNDLTIQENQSAEEDAAISLNDLQVIILNSTDSRLSPVPSDNLEKSVPLSENLSGNTVSVNEQHQEEVDHNIPQNNSDEQVGAINSHRQSLIKNGYDEKSGRSEYQGLNEIERSGFEPLPETTRYAGDEAEAGRRLNTMTSELHDMQQIPEHNRLNNVNNAGAAFNGRFKGNKELSGAKDVSEPVEIRSELNVHPETGGAGIQHKRNNVWSNESKDSMRRNESKKEKKHIAPKVHIGQVDVVVQVEERPVYLKNQSIKRADQPFSGARRYLRGV